MSGKILRSAGILLHITSLPSAFGIGDLGPEARKFADFLNKGRQQYWQLLPLNPIEASKCYSPYSSNAAMAGNILLISPEDLVTMGLLDRAFVRKFRLPVEKQVDFTQASRAKQAMLQAAYIKFVRIAPPSLKKRFQTFCRDEAFWIDRFSLYRVLKEQHQGKPWFEWPSEFKLKSPDALRKFCRAHRADIEKIKWEQFIFFTQWRALKGYCHERNVLLFGDLPFYVSLDSADVWAHPDIFSIDRRGKAAGVAGVPPDYFNSNGQLWGMPVFRWSVLKKKKYRWWQERIRKNIEMFSLLRLDHFRAFESYWEVPAGDKTAKNGKWKPGPGIEFFSFLKRKLGPLPFIAEDLGEITDEVRHLRDTCGFPGMKVLQFAFHKGMSDSEHIPHNYDRNFAAYTGTHDNNTTVGWFRQDASHVERNNLMRYLGKEINEDNVHAELSRAAYASVADLVVLPMQDLLGLDETHRMNKPAAIAGNWSWRLSADVRLAPLAAQLKLWTTLYNRSLK